MSADIAAARRSLCVAAGQFRNGSAPADTSKDSPPRGPTGAIQTWRGCFIESELQRLNFLAFHGARDEITISSDAGARRLPACIARSGKLHLFKLLAVAPREWTWI